MRLSHSREKKESTALRPEIQLFYFSLYYLLLNSTHHFDIFSVKTSTSALQTRKNLGSLFSCDLNLSFVFLCPKKSYPSHCKVIPKIILDASFPRLHMTKTITVTVPLTHTRLPTLTQSFYGAKSTVVKMFYL